MNATDYDIRDLKLADQGKNRIEWALQEMPVLRELTAVLAKPNPLKAFA